MATMVKSFAIQGIDGFVVDIEVKTLDGQPMISVIGLPDQAVKEAAERIHSALDESGYDFPKKKIIISLAPGDQKKRGSHFDLAMAVGLLQETEAIAARNMEKYALIGELSLNGELRACQGILPMVMAARKNGINHVIVPADNSREAKLVKGLNVLCFETLTQVVQFLEGKTVYVSKDEKQIQNENVNTLLDFADVKGQQDLIDAVVLAAAGGHNLLMIGEPGCGKTMIAQRIPSILPLMTEEECLEVTKIYSISGLVNKGTSMIRHRPFRAPHHNASLNALIGGGINALPGEVSLAHNGVLFLDELAEFSRRTLDALRQPIEDKKVSISRVNGMNTFPANFMFVTAMNPCPCGYYPGKKCRCTDYEIIKYRGKISGPIMDRIDIQKEVHPVDYFKLKSATPTPSSEELREKVERARTIQQKRYAQIEGVNCNAQMSTSMIQEYCYIDEELVTVLKEHCEAYGYSARVIHKLLRLARTSADLDGAKEIRKGDIIRVLACRDLDKSNSEMMVVS